MALVTLLTSADFLIPALVDQVAFTLPVGKRYISSDVLTLPPATERLGIEDVDLVGNVVYLKGMDSFVGQHSLRVTYGEDFNIVATGVETITTLVDNGDGTYTYTSENGTTTVVDTSDTTIVSTLVDNGDGTLTYTDETGLQTTFSTVVVDTSFVEAARYQIITDGPIESCLCPCGDRIPIKVGEEVWIYLIDGARVRGVIVSASRDYASDGGQRWVYTIAVNDAITAITKETLKCINCKPTT